MRIETDIKDRNGVQIQIGSRIKLYDWDKNKTYLGEAEVYFDEDEGCVSIEPHIIDNQYDLWKKAFPRCEVIL